MPYSFWGSWAGAVVFSLELAPAPVSASSGSLPAASCPLSALASRLLSMFLDCISVDALLPAVPEEDEGAAAAEANEGAVAPEGPLKGITRTAVNTMRAQAASDAATFIHWFFFF